MNPKKTFNMLGVLALALIIGVLLISLPLTLVSAKESARSDKTDLTALSFDTVPITPPKRLAIYYGWPSYVNGAGGDISRATAVFTNFEIVVFGDGLEHPSHGDHTNTITITNNLRDTNIEVYGYIDLGVSTSNLLLPTITTFVDEWAAMNVTGIFFDDAGKDFGVSRTRLISAVNIVHNHNLTAFVNAWNPDDIFADDPEGPTPLKTGDLYLAESHPVANGQCPNLDLWWIKSQKLITYRNEISGLRIAAIGTGDSGSTTPMTNSTYWSSYPPLRQTLWTTYLFGFDAFGFTDPNYSASCSCLRPLPPVPKNIGQIYLGPPIAPVISTGVLTYSRSTDKGAIYVFGNADAPTICEGIFLYNVFLPLILKPG